MNQIILNQPLRKLSLNSSLSQRCFKCKGENYCLITHAFNGDRQHSLAMLRRKYAIAAAELGLRLNHD